VFGIHWCDNMPIAVITALFIKPVDFVHVKERFYKQTKKKTVYVIVAMHQPSDGDDGEA